MRYRVIIAVGWSSSHVADTVARNHGDWDHAVDGEGGQTGIVFITANEGEDQDLMDAMDAHSGVAEYEVSHRVVMDYRLTVAGSVPTSGELNSELRSALVTLVEIIETLGQTQLASALDEIDLSDEGFKEALDSVKQAIKWQDGIKEIGR